MFLNIAEYEVGKLSRAELSLKTHLGFIPKDVMKLRSRYLLLGKILHYLELASIVSTIIIACSIQFLDYRVANNQILCTALTILTIYLALLYEYSRCFRKQYEICMYIMIGIKKKEL